MPLFNPTNISTVQKSSSVTPTASVAASTSSVTILAANTNRLGGTIFNKSTSDLYINFGDTASTTTFISKIAGDGGYYEIPYNYTGIVTGIWDVADGSALVGELLP